MSNPSPYVVGYSFSDFRANNPSSPLPAPPLDNELANAAAAISELVTAITDVRRSDGALNNGVVTFESLDLAVQLMLDPSNATLVANAVATAQAAASAANVSAVNAAASAAAALVQAMAAAASAAAVDLTLYLPKAGNLAGIGSPATARTNLQAPKVDGSDLTGRLSTVTGVGVADWNNIITSGWYTGIGAANGPDATNWWIGEVVALDASTVVQVVHSVNLASLGAASVVVFRRYSFDSAGVRTWTLWECAQPTPVGSTIWVNGSVAPAGFVKENGALLARASFPALYAYAATTGNITSEANWAAGASGAFTTGDLSTTFRIPDARGEFIRGFDDGRGIDAGRVIGSRQADTFKDHTHNYSAGSLSSSFAGGGGPAVNFFTPTATTGASTGSGTETRGRNIPKLACIKY